MIGLWKLSGAHEKSTSSTSVATRSTSHVFGPLAGCGSDSFERPMGTA